MLSGSLACREIRISSSSERLINPRSNIQCAVPERAMPLVRISGPFASTGLMWAASTSARPPPFMSFKPVIAQRLSYACNTSRRNKRLRTIRDESCATRSRSCSNMKGACVSSSKPSAGNNLPGSSNRGNSGSCSSRPIDTIRLKSAAEIGRTAACALPEIRPSSFKTPRSMTPSGPLNGTGLMKSR